MIRYWKQALFVLLGGVLPQTAGAQEALTDGSVGLPEVGGSLGALGFAAIIVDRVAAVVKKDRANKKDSDYDDLRRDLSDLRSAHATTREQVVELRATLSAMQITQERIENQLARVLDILSSR